MPAILKNTPQQFYDDVMRTLYVSYFYHFFKNLENQRITYNELKLNDRIKLIIKISILIQFQNHSKLAYDYTIKIPGLKPIMPNGAMYMMVNLKFYLFRDFSIYDS